jgi:hypothetical protein
MPFRRPSGSRKSPRAVFSENVVQKRPLIFRASAGRPCAGTRGWRRGAKTFRPGCRLPGCSSTGIPTLPGGTSAPRRSRSPDSNRDIASCRRRAGRASGYPWRGRSIACPARAAGRQARNRKGREIRPLSISRRTSLSRQRQLALSRIDRGQSVGRLFPLPPLLCKAFRRQPEAAERRRKSHDHASPADGSNRLFR